MGRDKTVCLRFNERETFSHFCVALRDDHVAFGLAAFQSVVLTEGDLEALPCESRKRFEEAKTSHKVTVYSPASSAPGRPVLPSERETEELLRSLTEDQ